MLVLAPNDTVRKNGRGESGDKEYISDIGRQAVKTPTAADQICMPNRGDKAILGD